MADTQTPQVQNQTQNPTQNQWEVAGQTPIQSTSSATPVTTSSDNQNQWEVAGQTPIDTGAQPGFWERAYEASGLKGMFESAKQKELENQAVGQEALNYIKSGNYSQAAETLLKHFVNSGGAASVVAPGVGPVLQDALAGSINQGKEAIQKTKEAATKPGLLPKAEAVESAVKSVPLVGPMANSIVAPATQDIYNKNIKGVAGDITGGIAQILPFLWGAEEMNPEAAEAEATGTGKVTASSNKTLVRPTTTKIAGEDVPVSTPQLENQSKLSKAVTKAATPRAAQDFIEQKVNPAAQRAAQSNFSQAANNSINELRQLRGEPETADRFETLNDIHSGLKKEAQKTYNKLDEAAERDRAEWSAKNRQAQDANEPSKIIDPDTGKPVEKDAVEVPEKPPLFTELQDKINSAERTIKSRLSSQTDKDAAINNLPKYQQQMNDFLSKHKDIVQNGELEKADDLWKRADQFNWLDKRIRSATKGTSSVSDVKGSPVTWNPKTLENIRQSFNNKYGVDSFENLLGKQGLKNYNDIINILKNPMVRGEFSDWLKTGMAGAGGEMLVHGAPGVVLGLAGKIGITKLVDNLLFNPEFGQKLIQLWKDESGSLGLPGTVNSTTKNPLSSEAIANENNWFQQAKSELGPNANVSDIAKRAQELKQSSANSVTLNASGESSASKEAINRYASEKNAGIKRYKITRSGQEIPLFGPDAIDVSAGKGETIVKRYPDGHEEIQDQGQGAHYNPKSNYARQVYSGTRSALGGNK